MLQFVTLRVYQIEVHLPYEIRANRVRRIFKTIIELVVAVARQPVGKYPPIFFRYHLFHLYNNNNNKIIITTFLSSPRKFPKKRTLRPFHFPLHARYSRVIHARWQPATSHAYNSRAALRLIARNFSRPWAIRSVGKIPRGRSREAGINRGDRYRPVSRNGMEPSRVGPPT